MGRLASPRSPRVRGGLVGYFDLRLLPIRYDLAGERRVAFERAVINCREDPLPGRPIKGPRSCLWECGCIFLNGGPPTGRHTSRKHDAELQLQDVGVAGPERCRRPRETMACYDQLNLPARATAEHLALALQVRGERGQEYPSGHMDDPVGDAH
ncbi:unnamed protein product [Prorocentrum cordatum]|uniref:C2H2-type domain-containing protein n=1 Tax=Prorocentrum cordatum TaxID=2364126 RepID=A0ABN9TZA9_9DINO|nr:unnamed protein product [Polarella glacialis]